MKKILMILALIFAAMFICVGCNNNSIEKHEEKIIESMSSVKVVNSLVKVYDSEILVYEQLTKTEMLENGSAEVIKNTSALGSNFTLETIETNESINSINKNELFKLSLKEELLTNIQFDENGNLSCEVTSENFNKVFNSQNLRIEGNAKLIFNYVDKKISEVKITFVTISSKDVIVSVTYGY